MLLKKQCLGGFCFAVRKNCHFESFLRWAGTLVVTLMFCKGPTDVFCRRTTQLWKIFNLNPGRQAAAYMPTTNTNAGICLMPHWISFLVTDQNSAHRILKFTILSFR